MFETKKSHLDSSKSIAEEFFRSAETDPDQVFARRRTILPISDTVSYWEDITMSLAAEKVRALAQGLKENGLGKGSRIAIISNSRVEWLIADLAIMAIGGVSVSIYQSLLPKEIAFILHDSETEAVFAENQEQINKLDEILNNEWEIPQIEDREKKNIRITLSGIIAFEEVESSSIKAKDFNELIKLYIESAKNFEFDKTVSREDLASLVYTSGTTGAPKGVMQTHGNHLSNVRQVLDSGLMIPRASVFLFLPLAHSFARLMGYLGSLTDLSVSFPEVADTRTSKLKPAIIMRDMAEANAHIFPIVPRFLEKIRDQLQLQSQKKGLASLLIRLTLDNAEQKKNASGTFLTPLLFLLLTPMRKKIINKLFGNSFKYGVSGGAKLSVPVHSFFDMLGIAIYEGYGLTETVVATNACTPHAQKIGSVGRVLSKDIELKILEDGEIAYRGPNISPGYYNRPEATKNSWDNEGWFLTGDIGKVDEDGFLFITGRKKEIIVTSGGKNVAPLPIEEKIMDSPLISQAIVIGDGRKFCSAILTLNKEAIQNKAGNEADKLDLMNPESCELTRTMLWEHLDKVNQTLASYEGIKKIHIVSEEFSVENGLLTPSMKIKRNEVEKRYKEQIDALYS
jgi:long-chain acyl-CoA synthetase